jgi:protein-S-isoprenylcysteine O-methyltransferase Ste14
MEHLQTLDGLNLVFYLANGLWLFEFILFRNRSRNGQFKDPLSFYGLTGLIGLTIFITILFNREGWGRMVNTTMYPWFQILGIFFYVLGLYLRYHASILLGTSFTRHVNVDKNMTLVSKGPYKYLRHPLYLGLFLLVIAFPLYAGNWMTTLVFLFLNLMGLLFRIRIEEKALELHLPHYKTWKKARYRIIPFIY